MPDRSVHLVVTSPPYWQLKDYGTDEQIGYHDTYEDYVNDLNLVWQECHRVLYPGCRLCVNVGDQFARSAYYGRYKVIPIRTEIIKFCESVGFDYMGAIIWQKVTTTNTTGGATIMGSYPNPRNGILKLDYEFILIFKKHGKAPKPDPTLKAKSAMTKEEWNSWFTGHWNFPGARQDGHIAMFPEELPARLIRMFAFMGDTVLDPFLGSGTTSLAAKNLGRNSVGYEINPEYFSAIRQKLNVGESPETDFDFLTESPPSNLGERLESLPYHFQDPLKFDKKNDPKQRQFGSRIDGNGKVEREEYFTVKKILSPVLLRLSDGSTIRLTGLKAKKESAAAAIDFLQQKTSGQRVYLRNDGEEKLDEEGHRLCYLYLKNRTFLNVHLLKNSLAKVDAKQEFKHREKFLKIEKSTK